MFFKKKKYETISSEIYQKIVKFSRNKIFYTKYKVPDTIDGRFDMLVLITILVIFRLSRIKDEGVELSQNIFDIIFKDLDFSLRELGAGDVSVANNMKKLISSYMGRQKIYTMAFKNNDKRSLALAFKNNIYRNNEQNQNLLLLLSDNVFKIIKKLDLIEDKKIINGNFDLSVSLL
jgi:cytochrome b pre-mRNA-processing protein 3